MSKPWERPWSMGEIIENSDKWNLAGDVALLNTLKAFADNLLTKTTEINNDLQNLTNSLDETSLQLNIAQNEFQGLRNSQFIESRVYEDDESLVEAEVEKKKEEESDDRSEDIKVAALKGLEVLEQYFEKVEVSVSDSEDEDIDLPNYVLRPKDLYIERPLPYVIGSDEWHKNWHVGLEDSSSDSETEKVSDKFSESDSDSDLPIQNRSQMKNTSDTSSELDFSQKIEPKLKNDFFHSSDSENSVPAQGPISSKNFAEQLAAKLGHVITDYEEPEVNRRPIQTTPHYGDIFFDEPPPLDEPKGPFSGRGLFDDEDSAPMKKSGGLFDGGESSDEDIFAKKTPQIAKPLFAEEPPALDEKKKPVGGVSIFGGGNLFDKKLLRTQVSDEDEKKEDSEKKIDLFGSAKNEKKVNLFDSDEEDARSLFSDEKTQNVEKVFQEVKEQKTEKKISLFDDDLFKDDLFSTSTTKKLTSGLFDDIPGDDLFATKVENKPKPSGNLFDDLAIPDKNSINSDRKVETKEKVEVRTEKSTEEKSSPKNDLFGNLENRKATLSLFDSPPPEPDDLFGVTKTPELFDSPPKTDFTSTSHSTPAPIPNMRLFDPSPPPDDDWDTKSDNLSENNDFCNDFEEASDTKTNLFSEEPPSFDFKTETGAKKPGKLKHNLNINVGALMPGSVPPKRSDGVAKTSPDHVAKTSPDHVVKPPIDYVSKPSFSNVTKTSSNEVTKTSFSNSTKSDVAVTSFDEPDRVEVLPSVTKDRVKVPLKRRPSTRRGRQAALRHSGVDFKLEGEENLEKEEIGEEKVKKMLESDDLSVKNVETEKSSDSLGIKSPKRDVRRSLFETPKNDNLFETENVPNSSDLLEAQKVPKSDELFETPNIPKSEDLFETQKIPKSDDLFKAQNIPKSSDLFETQKIPKSDDLFKTQNIPKSSDLFETQKMPKIESDDLFETQKIPKSDLFKTQKNPKSSDLFETQKMPKSDHLFKPQDSPKNDVSFVTKNDVPDTSKTDQSDPKSSQSQKSGLFDDEDDDELFSSKKSVQPTKVLKKSLFDDDDNDDDDIFKSFSSASVKKVEAKIATEKKIAKVSSVKKLENTKPDDDPLSALLK